MTFSCFVQVLRSMIPRCTIELIPVISSFPEMFRPPRSISLKWITSNYCIRLQICREMSELSHALLIEKPEGWWMVRFSNIFKSAIGKISVQNNSSRNMNRFVLFFFIPVAGSTSSQKNENSYSHGYTSRNSDSSVTSDVSHANCSHFIPVKLCYIGLQK